MTSTCVEHFLTSAASIHASKCPVLRSHAFHWQEAREQREASVCSRFVRGICPFGDNCKFSHDVEAYLASKPADLPGQCPYTASPECPYGKSSLEHCTSAQNPIPKYHEHACISVESCASLRSAVSLSCEQHAQLSSALPPDSTKMVTSAGLTCLWAGTHINKGQAAQPSELEGPLTGNAGALQPDPASLRGSSMEVSCPANGANGENIATAILGKPICLPKHCMLCQIHSSCASTSARGT